MGNRGFVISVIAVILILGVIVPSLSISPDEAYADKKNDKKHEKFDKNKDKVRDELEEKIKKSKKDTKLRVIISVTDEIENDIERLGGKILYKYSIIDAIAAEIPAGKIHNIANATSVSFVDMDATVQTFAQTIPWGIDRINAPDTWSQSTGSDIQVAILDTGIDPKHNDLKQNIEFGISFDRGKISTNEKNWKDKNGHGTHVAGTVAALNNDFGVVGAAHSTGLYAVRVLSSSGSGFVSDIIAAIDWAVKGPDGANGTDDDPEVISMSLGTKADVNSFHQAVDNAYADGIVLVAAAGNSGDGNPNTEETLYPAAYDSVIAVGAIDINNNAPSWTNSGNYVELAAPGVSVLSTYRGNAYAYLSGTSMATPHVSGTIALMLAANPSLTPDQIRDNLIETATDLGPSGWDNIYGNGLVNAKEAVNSVLTSPPEDSPPINNVPEANDDAYSTNEGTALIVDAASGVLDNDTDIDGDTLTAIIDSGPSNGSVTLNSDGSFTYMPISNFNGADSFTYHANDGTTDSNIAEVSITVNKVSTSPASIFITSHSETVKDRKGDLIFKSEVLASVDGQPTGVKYTYIYDNGELILEKIKKAELKINKARSDLKNIAEIDESKNTINFDLSSFSFNDGDAVQIKLELIYENASTGTPYSFTVYFDPEKPDTQVVSTNKK